MKNTDYIALNAATGELELERKFLVGWTKFQNPTQVVEAARKNTPLPEGFAWHAVGHPALVARARVADADGAIVAPRSVVEAAINAAIRAEEHNLADYLKSKLA